MKKSLIASIALAASLIFSGAAFANEITIVNGTGFDIHGLGLVDNNASGDVEDLLGDEILSAGSSITLDIQGDGAGWALLAVDPEGNQATFSNINLGGVGTITLHGDATATLQ